MKLHRFTLGVLPGLAEGFTLRDLDPALNLVIGPNGSGKTSLCRAFRLLFYPEESIEDFVQIEAQVAVGKTLYTVTRIGSEIRWRDEVGNLLPREPLKLPEHRFVRCYTLTVDDFFTEGETEKTIYRHILRELSGGYDLVRVRESAPFQPKIHHARREAQILREATRAYHAVLDAHMSIAKEEARLEELRSSLDRADEASRRLHQLQAVVVARERRRRCVELHASLAEFPENMEAINGGEWERGKRLQEQISHLDKRIEMACREKQLAEQERSKECGESLSSSHVIADFALVRRQIADLREARFHRESALGLLQEARAQAEAIATALTGTNGSTQGKIHAEITASEVRAAEADIEYLREKRVNLKASEALLAYLDPVPDAEHNLNQLRQVRHACIDWLVHAPVTRGIWVAGALSLISALMLLMVAFSLTPAWTLLSLPLGAFPILALWQKNQGREHRRKSEAIGKRMAEDWLASPKIPWTRAEITAQLSSLDRAIGEAALHRRMHEWAAVIRQEVHENKRLYAEALRTASEHTQGFGFDSGILDASLTRWLRLVAEQDETLKSSRQAEIGHTRAMRAAEKLENTLSTLVSMPCQALAAMSIDELISFVDRVEREGQAIESQKHRVDSAVEMHTRFSEQRALLQDELSALFASTGLMEVAQEERWRELERRVSAHGAWSRLREALVEAREGERIACLPIAQAPEMLALIDKPGTLEEEMFALQALTTERDAVLREIARVEKSVTDAMAQRGLEEARATQEMARARLQERFTEALYSVAGEMVMEEVMGEYEARTRPRVLVQAQEWFRRFTRNQFTLRFRTEAEAGLSAVENASGEERLLVQLSSATRMQLLLAVRLAFALEAESEAIPLPFFLDEVLTMSDPQRYREVIRALHILSTEDDRQLFYLSAQPTEIGLWEEAFEDRPKIIDLQAVRQRGEGLGEEVRYFALPPLPDACPEPLDLSAHAYGNLLGVPRIERWQRWEAIHPFHLLIDQLDWLPPLVNAGADSLGGLCSLIEAGAAEALLDKRAVSSLLGRIEALRTYLLAAREGYGRPLTRVELEHAPISPGFREKIFALCERFEGEAKAFLQALDNGEVSRFHRRGAPRERLADWLADEYFIDPRERLTAAAIEHRVIAAVGVWFDTTELDLMTVRELIQWWGRAANSTSLSSEPV